MKAIVMVTKLDGGDWQLEEAGGKVTVCKDVATLGEAIANAVSNPSNPEVTAEGMPAYEDMATSYVASLLPPGFEPLAGPAVRQGLDFIRTKYGRR